MGKKITIGVIGGGNMGAAIVQGVKGSFNVCVHEIDPQKRRQLKKMRLVKLCPLNELLSKANVFVLAVKPQNFTELLEQIKGKVNSRQLIVSIAAGISCSYIEKSLGTKVKVIRTMPNLPVQVAEGITAITKGKYARPSDVRLAERIFAKLGKTVIVNENLMDSITALSGSGPAYVFYFIESLVKAGEKLGLEKKIAQKLTLQTLKGSVRLLEAKGEDAAIWRERVTSKGGTTQAALKVMSAAHLEGIYQKALQAAKSRAKELSRS